MTPAELPQLSLRRYFDLVKRRRWQVVPISVLGLLVGGVIAFFIPRYYVANVTLFHQGGREKLAEDDPMRRIVATATVTIRLQARKVIEKLKWPEAVSLDAHDLEQFTKVVAGNISVFDVNAADRGRDFAQIYVGYRDRDGKRVAEFLNELVKTWVDTRIEDLRRPVEQDRKKAHEAVERWDGIQEQFRADRRELELRYQFEPGIDIAVQRSDFTSRQKARDVLLAELVVKQAQLAELNKDLEQKRALLAAMPERVAATAESLIEVAAKTDRGKVLLLEIQYLRIEAAGFKKGTVWKRIALRKLAAAEKQLQELVAPSTESTDGLLGNPLYAKLKDDIAKLEIVHAGLSKAVELLGVTVRTDTEQLAARSLGFIEYDRLQAEIEQAKGNYEKAIKERDDADSFLARLDRDAPVRPLGGPVAPPPRPTEPNILVIALLGCVLGLGAAIALILLLDLLQGSFKTMDDVERGLAVPVLGGVSHLETDVERTETSRTRTRALVVAFVFTALVATVTTIFYLDPTRLPPVVRDLMALVLGRD